MESPALELMSSEAWRGELGGRPGEGLVFLGTRERLLTADLRAHLPVELHPIWPALVEELAPGDAGAGTTTWLATDPPTPVGIGVLPSRASHHDAPARPDALTKLIRELTQKERASRLLVAPGSDEQLPATLAAVVRAFPVYSRKSGGSASAAGHRVAFLGCDPKRPAHAWLEVLGQGISEAMRWQDTPAAELHTDAFVDEARRVAEAVGAECHVIRGQALRDQGLGGLWAVGRAAAHPPALVVLRHDPAQAERNVAWVGKGIVYDTGGLALKSLDEMQGMKGDMGGAAAVLGAFGAAARLGARDRIHALLCIAENAIGPEALRPDDVITLYSGRSVEVVNPDAEGRLVLGDGVAYAAGRLRPDLLVDLGTLTDGQLVATGRRHGAIVCNDAAWEARAVQAGRRSGDLVHPLPWCPELYRAELASEVADMRNAARDRKNADVSCAAQFVAEHLGSWEGPWLHVDLEGPSRNPQGGGTGFGVALLLGLFGYI